MSSTPCKFDRFTETGGVLNTKTEILGVLTTEYREIFNKIPSDIFSQIEEIRIRAERPISITRRGAEWFVSHRGELLPSPVGAKAAAIGNAEAITKIVEKLCSHSPYAFENELGAGYITIRGGHRVGIVGRAVVEGGRVRTLRNISGLNIRVSHEIRGCAAKIIGHIVTGRQVYHTLIISSPGCGKTTLLRDIIRSLSSGEAGSFDGVPVAVVDERSEIAGCYMGVAQHDVGPRTDVLDACPKAEGMLMLLRSMSPKVIAVDEIGRADDVYAIEEVINAGVSVLCTIHGGSLDEVQQKPTMQSLLDKKIFKRFIVLQGRGHITAIYDENYRRIGG